MSLCKQESGHNCYSWAGAERENWKGKRMGSLGTTQFSEKSSSIKEEGNTQCTKLRSRHDMQENRPFPDRQQLLSHCA